MPIVQMVGPKYMGLTGVTRSKVEAEKAIRESDPYKKAQEKQEFYGNGGLFDRADCDKDCRINCSEFKLMSDMMCDK